MIPVGTGWLLVATLFVSSVLVGLVATRLKKRGEIGESLAMRLVAIALALLSGHVFVILISGGAK